MGRLRRRAAVRRWAPGAAGAAGAAETRLAGNDYGSLKEARDAFESEFIRRKLAENEGNVSRTAEALDIQRSHLYRKLRALGIEVDRREPERRER